MTLPDVGKVAWAYGLPFVRIADKADLSQQIRAVLEMAGPVVCEVMGRAKRGADSSIRVLHQV